MFADQQPPKQGFRKKSENWSTI